MEYESCIINHIVSNNRLLCIDNYFNHFSESLLFLIKMFNIHILLMFLTKDLLLFFINLLRWFLYILFHFLIFLESKCWLWILIISIDDYGAHSSHKIPLLKGFALFHHSFCESSLKLSKHSLSHIQLCYFSIELLKRNLCITWIVPSLDYMTRYEILACRLH